MRSTMGRSGGRSRIASGDAGRIRQHSRIALGLSFLWASGLCGCDPVINIAGANFPAWMFCVLAGAALAAAARLVFIALGIDRYLWMRPLVYVSLAVLSACIVYAVLFNRV